MEYYMNHFGGVFQNKKDDGLNIYTGSGITVQAFHLNRGTSLFERPDNNSLVNGNHVVTYLVIRGRIEFRLEEERVELLPGNSIIVVMDQNFTAWALEDTDIIAVHNCEEPNVDTTPQELINAVKKVELADDYLRGHNYRVGKYSTLIMQAINPEKATPKFHMAAAYHDVGKVVVDNKILNKDGRLSSEEFEEVKKHPAASFDMLKPYLGSKTANFARWHHEKLDGSGYPDGIMGDDIPLESRVLAVADIFDALTTSRCYRSAFSFDKALDILEEGVKAGKLDSEAFYALKRLVEAMVIVEGVDNVAMSAENIKIKK